MNKNQGATSKLRQFLLATAEGKSYTVSITTGLLLLVVITFGIFPALNATFEQYTKNQEKTDTINQINAKLQTLQSLFSEEQSKSEVISFFNKRFPNQLNEEDVVVILNQYAIAGNISLDSIVFSPVEQRRNVAQTFGVNSRVTAKYVSINVEGSIGSLETFLHQIESTTRIFNVRNFGYQHVETRNIFEVQSGRDYTMALRAEVFYWNEPK